MPVEVGVLRHRDAGVPELVSDHAPETGLIEAGGDRLGEGVGDHPVELSPRARPPHHGLDVFAVPVAAD